MEQEIKQLGGTIDVHAEMIWKTLRKICNARAGDSSLLLVAMLPSGCGSSPLNRRESAREATAKTIRGIEEGLVILGAVEVEKGHWSSTVPDSKDFVLTKFYREGELTFESVLDKRKSIETRTYYEQKRRLVEQVDWSGHGVGDLFILFDKNQVPFEALVRQADGTVRQADPQKLSELKVIFSTPGE